ncbi:MAG: GNAT family N-acetyltransferase [Niabella sp.]
MQQNIPFDFYVNDYLFSFDKSKIQPEAVYKYLHEESYWAQRIPFDIVQRSIDHSLCLGIYDHTGVLTGFGRMITDRATFAYLADIFVLKGHRGKGLSKAMVKAFCDLADDLKVRRFMLATQDAHGLYLQYGFEALTHPERIMARKGVTY